MESPTSTMSPLFGFESATKDYFQAELSLEEFLVEKPGSTFVSTMSGDDMEQAGVYDGDLLIIDKDLRVQNKDIVVVSLNGEIKCRMINTHNQVLISCNVEYQDEQIEEMDDFVLIGVVTRSIRCFRPLKRLDN